MRSRHHERGFTLIELLISISITTIILGAITSAMIVFLKNGAYTLERDDHSGGALLVSTYLNRDLASADSVRTTGTTCAGASAAHDLTLEWDEWVATDASPEPGPDGGSYSASYAVRAHPVTAGRFQFVRILCKPSSTETTVLVQSLTAASAAAAVEVTSPIAATADCPSPGGVVYLRLPRYANDSTEQRYSYAGCARGRIS